LLEAQLVEWSGTLLLVSHDRVFLDHVVTSTLAFESGGRVSEYVGGYDDWLRQRPRADSPETPVTKAAISGPESGSGHGGRSAAAGSKLSYKEQRELQALPQRIEALEQEQSALHARINSPDFYKEDGAAIAAALDRVQEVDAELLGALARWDELESRAGRK
jgi:ATP-binding cassette subfamily F protein uup